MKKPDKLYLQFNDVIEFFKSSYIFGFENVLDFLAKNKEKLRAMNFPIPTRSQMEYFLSLNENNIRTYLTECFREINIDINKVIVSLNNLLGYSSQRLS